MLIADGDGGRAETYAGPFTDSFQFEAPVSDPYALEVSPAQRQFIPRAESADAFGGVLGDVIEKLVRAPEEPIEVRRPTPGIPVPTPSPAPAPILAVSAAAAPVVESLTSAVTSLLAGLGGAGGGAGGTGRALPIGTAGTRLVAESKANPMLTILILVAVGGIGYFVYKRYIKKGGS